MQTQAAPAPLADLLKEYSYTLMSLARGLYVVEAVEAELERVSRGKPFRVFNDVTWLMLGETYGMLVIRLASWARSVYEPGGLLGQVQAHHTRALPRERRMEPDDGTKAYQDRFHGEAYGRLFSCACQPFPTPVAFTALREAFEKRMRPVLNDRSDNRAHPYERAGSKATAKMLETKELRVAMTYAEEFMNDLQLVGTVATTRYHEMNATSSGLASRDIADSVLLGTSRRARIVRKDAKRDELFAKMHAWHDALPSGSEELFNEMIDGSD